MIDKTHIIKNPELEDCFVRLEPAASFQELYDRYGDDLARWYESGKVILIDNPPFQANTDILWNVTYPPDDRPIKKMKMRHLLQDYTKNHQLRKVFGDDVAEFKKFRAETIRVTDFIWRGLKTMFPKYKIVGDLATWRFAVTHTEDLHLDDYGRENPKHHYLRAFWNADSYPRIWLVGAHRREIAKMANIDLPSSDASATNRILNQFLGKSLGRQPSHTPQHLVAFKPGAMWIVHSEYVPHSIVFGRRLVGVSHEVDPRSMADPKLWFELN